MIPGSLNTMAMGGAAASAPLLLDVYGANCVGAWSAARKLKTGATQAYRAEWGGSSTYDVEFTTADVANTAALLAAVGGNTATVSTMYDQSGNSRNLTQSYDAARPRIVNSGVLDAVDGFPAPYYVGARWLDFANWASLTGLSGNPSFTVFVVYEKTAGDGHVFSWGDYATSLSCVGIYDDGSLAAVGYAGGASKSFTAPSTSQLNLTSVLKSSGQIIATTAIYRDGADVSISGGTGSFPTISSGNFPLHVGGWGSGSSFYINGHIIELIIYAANKSSDRAAIESNIMTFYGL